MRSTKGITAVLALLALGACKDLKDIPDYNASSLGDLQSAPTQAAIQVATTGLLAGARAENSLPQFSYVAALAEMGREGYALDPSNPQITQERLEGPLSRGSFAGFIWEEMYRNIKQGDVVLDAVDGVTEFTSADVEGVRGFVKTIQARDLLTLINIFDDNGIVIDVLQDPAADPAPIVNKATAFGRIVSLLNEGATHLGSAGASFSFDLSTGFSDFSTPSTFLQFNRALKARVDVYMGNYTDALTSLTGSFLDTAAPFSLGAYHTHSTNSGDLINVLFDPTPRIIHGHPSNATDAQMKGNGDPDDRLAAKEASIPSKVLSGLTVDTRFIHFTSLSDPIPIIRNEELILLRAEARMMTGDIPGALTDLNLVRQSAGGLDPITSAAWNGMTTDQRIDALLYERRFSLLFEGGHRWIDWRRLGRLAQIPLVAAAHKMFPYFTFPDDECTQRSPEPGGCTAHPGL